MQRSVIRTDGRLSASILLFFTLFTAAALLFQGTSGAFRADRGLTNDEAAHLVTALFLADFLTHGWWLHPMDAILDYYKHFPRVAIGHWPPFFHLIQGLAFLVLGRSVATALIVQALVAGLAAAGAAAVAALRWGRSAGLATGALVLLSPKFLFLVDAVMLDNLTGLLVLLTALAWGRYWRERSTLWAALFALSAGAAVMTKGNAIGLALCPLLHGALMRDASFLRNARTWAAAAMVGMIAAPWYAFTYKMSAAGFVYSWGWDFTSHALAAYSRAAADALGFPALLGALTAIAMIVSGKEHDSVLAALASVVLALFAFQCATPADIQPRYLLALVPAIAPLAVGGLFTLARTVARRRFGPGLGAAAVTALSITLIYQPPHTTPLRMDSAAARILGAEAPNPLVLVCGSTRGEGALIAAFALAEAMPTHYVLRGFKTLASGNFMGSDYRMKKERPDQVLAWLAEQQIGWLVVEDTPESLAWPHNRMVVTLAEAGAFGASLADYAVSGGRVLVYALPGAQTRPTSLDIVEENAPNTPM